MFLTPKDYDTLLSFEDKQILDKEDNMILADAERMAIEEVSTYLRSCVCVRYDLARIFFEVLPFYVGTAYGEGMHVYDLITYEVYYALQDTNGEPLNDTAFWKKGDKRNALIKMYLIDCVKFHLYAHVSVVGLLNDNNKWYIRYQSAVAWLKDVRDCKNQPDLPTIADTTNDGIDDATAGKSPIGITNGRRSWYF